MFHDSPSAMGDLQILSVILFSALSDKMAAKHRLNQHMALSTGGRLADEYRDKALLYGITARPSTSQARL